MRRNLLIAVRMTVMTLLALGVAYPLLVTGVSQLVFPGAANGSLVRSGDGVVGSRLIGQGFSSRRYFHPRPSAAGVDGYDAAASSASNLGPTSRVLVEEVAGRVENIVATEPGAKRGEVPVDAVTTSASGLDPDISPDNAMLQVARVARARGLEEARVTALVRQHVKPRQFGVLGEPRVNVLDLNLALDALSSK